MGGCGAAGAKACVPKKSWKLAPPEGTPPDGRLVAIASRGSSAGTGEERGAGEERGGDEPRPKGSAEDTLPEDGRLV
jgi:hypothetical protein